jgi:hypothetical protein
MARRYLGYGREDWLALPWDLRRTYLEGMEADESVPLSFEMEGGEVTPGVPDGIQQRRAEVASVIDVEAMIADFSGG